VARLNGLPVTGTLGILERAHQMGLVDITEAIEDLVSKTNFYITDTLAQKVIAEALDKR
jgi:predicted nucleic acid-binding protein